MADSSQQIKEITKTLETGIKDLFNSDAYADYLKTMSHFHKYSTRNTLLIHLQKPGATLVASYLAWRNKFKRHVKRGEKSIKIFAPVPFTKRDEKEKLDPDTKQPVLDENGMPVMEYTEQKIARYKLVDVYDISQTGGEPLPTLAQNLTGNVEQYEAFMDALRAVSPLPIFIEPLPDDTDGKCVFGDRIVIREGMSEIQTVCAVIHEMTHSKLHDLEALRLADENADPKDRRTEEIEAESVSFSVCSFFGIETGANSWGYIAEWSRGRELKELNASLDTIRKTSAELIEAIDGKFQEIVKERNITFAIDNENTEISEKYTATEKIDGQKTNNIIGEAKTMSAEQKLYGKFADLFPKVVSGEYSYLRLEVGGGFEPLSLEWIGGNRISIMHTYEMNGDLMYDPMIVLKIDKNEKTLTAVEYEQSYPPLYQRIDEHGVGLSVDGNGRKLTVNDLQRQINDFTKQWLNNIDEQGYMPVRANTVINGEETQITFDNGGNIIIPKTNDDYDLGYGFFGNGIMVWNRSEERDGDYVTVAHIERDRTVTFYDENMPEEVKESIIKSTWIMEDEALEPLHQKSEPEKPNITELDLSLPDPTIGFSEMSLYGYSYDGMFPLTNGRAVELFDTNHVIYLLYQDNTEAMVLECEEIRNHDGLCGIEREDWERSPVRAAQLAVAANSEGSREAELLYGDGNRFGIYQIPAEIDEKHNFRFAPMEEIEALGLSVDRNNYKLVYTAPFSERIEFLADRYPVLDDIYEAFNMEHPDDYTGRSVSVSDVIVLKCNGDISSHFVDSTGFVELDAFLGDETKNTEISTQDGNLTLSQNGTRSEEYNGKSVSELETDVKSGKVISLIDLSKAVNAERKSTVAPKTKPTLKERLEANKIKAARQGQSEANKTNERRQIE